MVYNRIGSEIRVMPELREEKRTYLSVYCVDDVRADWIADFLWITYDNAVHLLRLERLRQGNVI